MPSYAPSIAATATMSTTTTATFLRQPCPHGLLPDTNPRHVYKCHVERLVLAHSADATDYYALCAAIDEIANSEETASVDAACGVRDISFIRNSLELERNLRCLNCAERRVKRRRAAARTRMELLKYSVAEVLDKVERGIGRVVGWCCEKRGRLRREKEFEWVRIVSPDGSSGRRDLEVDERELEVEEWKDF
ncbi:hypothetical protein K491DRAFT_675799 [Lophiostoma macrostomum CBS 122681]|uniref:Uncharacterized protein n=1 Tax=Lophiostoma macrostomum CBS 122681 TaxID=1314788 RepID=A0A6A6TGQ9_9PLEO|nr:hypothetical protein K491DRAFT_675799 [Lophiostoma macrostomum CBS 122681]